MVNIKSVEEFDELVLKDKVLVDFYAEWCGPCKMISPMLEKREKKGDFTLIKVNTDNFQDLALELGVHSIPDLKLYKKGKLIKESIGVLTKDELEELLK